MSAVPVLSIESLHLEIRERGDRRPVLRGVSLEIPRGAVHGLVGESGGGKTMVGRAALDILPAAAAVTGGAIRFSGRAPGSGGAPGREISMILQDPMAALNPVLRIGTQTTDVLRKHLGLSRGAARARARELLEAVRIREPERALRKYPHELSGGMRQRVIIAIAFACDPRLVIADEPTTALDVTVQKRILRLIKEQQSRTGAAVLFITHDLGVVAKICDEVSVMHAGRILETAPVADLFDAPRHDYTRALLAATPRHDRPAAALRPVPDELARRLWQEAFAYDEARRGA